MARQIRGMLMPLVLAAGCASAPVSGSAGSPPAATQASPDQVVIAGRVVSDKGPVPGALVRVAVPPRDMRSFRGEQLPGQIWETRTDEQGQFRLALPAGSKAAALDALAAGFASVAGTYMGGPTFSGVGSGTVGPFFLRDLQLPLRDEVTIRLVPALYVAGTAVNESGQPVEGVRVVGTVRGPRGYGYIASTVTDKEGRFAIFDFPTSRPAGDMNHGRLELSQRHMRRSIVEDLYTMSSKRLQDLRVVMHPGQSLRGTVVHADGQPAADVQVQAVPASADEERKETRTDRSGQFRLDGLPDGKVTVRAFTHPLREKFEKELRLPLKTPELHAQMQPLAPSEALKPVEVLGMKVVDLTPELARMYDLYTKQGVLVLDPGGDSERLGIGRLHEGNAFWIVGERKIRDLSEMITELLRINALEPPRLGGAIPEGHRGMIRVVYEFGHGRGTNTQYLKLTDADARSLEHLLKSLPPATQVGP